MKSVAPTLLCLLTACGSGEARISFTVPEGLGELTRSVRLRLVRPAAGDVSIDCEAIAFADIDAERLDGATERSLVIDGGASTDVGELARATRTLFVAEAFDGPAASGTLVAAGCAARDDVGGGALVIAGEPAIDLTGVDPSLTGGVAVDPGDVPARLTLVARDARQHAVSGLTVRLRVLDVGGQPLLIEAVTSGAGDVVIATDLLAARPIGAVRLLFGTRWQRTPLTIDTLAPPSLSSKDLGGLLVTGLAATRSGVAYVVLNPDIDVTSLTRLTAPGGVLTATDLGTLPVGFHVLVAVPSAASETIIGLWDDGYRTLDAQSGVFGAPQALSTGALNTATTAYVLPALGSDPPLVLLDTGIDDASPHDHAAFRYQGGALSVMTVPSFIGSDGVAWRAAGLVIDESGASYRAVATTTDLRLEGGDAPLTLPAGAGALTLSGGVLLVAVQTTSGPQVRTYAVRGTAGAHHLLQLDASLVSGSPLRVASVDLDGNADADVVSLVTTGSDAHLAFSLVYRGVEVEPRLSALVNLSALPATAVPSDGGLSRDRGIAFALDADGDGRAELWNLRNFVDVPAVGPGPPGPPQSGTRVDRLDFVP